jgi:biopolymer transport protein ExbB
MISKLLTIAAAIVLVCGLSAVSVAPAFAQDAAPAASSAPAANPNAAAAAIAQGEASTPYGLAHIWETGTIVSKGIIVVLAIMSAGTWYIFIT